MQEISVKVYGNKVATACLQLSENAFCLWRDHIKMIVSNILWEFFPLTQLLV